MPEFGFATNDIASVSIHDLGSVVILRLTGEIDLSTADAVDNALSSCLSLLSRAVIIDLTSVEFIGATGLNILVRAHRAALSRDIALRIVADTPVVLRSIGVSGLDAHLPLSLSVTSALKDVRDDMNVNAG